METHLETGYEDFDRWIKSVWRKCEGGETCYEGHWRQIVLQIERKAGSRLLIRMRTDLDRAIFNLGRVFRREDSK